MANQLKMATVHTIYTLLERGWSRRRIARTLGIDRETVARLRPVGTGGDSVGSGGRRVCSKTSQGAPRV